MPDPILDNLTDAQREAVTHTQGPMLVVAGAGSGKTRVVTRRIAHLIRQGVPARQILAMTFTNKAAGEMKARVEELVGTTPRWVGTFHSMCARFLRYDLDKLNEGRDGRFTIYDDTDQQGLVKTVLRGRDLDEKRFRPRSLLARISKAKSDMVEPDGFRDASWDGDVVETVYREYERMLRQMNALDFDDLLILTVKMLLDVPGLKERYQSRFPFVLVDEYQDTNHAQYQLMKLLAGPQQNVHATGDPDQSIYSWRGADYRNIMDFTKDFPEARLVRLEQNYRSTQTILAAANGLIGHNEDRIEKELFTEKEGGEKLLLAQVPDERAEAAWVVDQASRLRAEGRGFKDMAVFYRTNAQSRTFEEACMRSQVPYQVVGGVRFYQRKEIKDLLAHLKLLVNPRDVVSLGRVADCRPTGVGDKTLAALADQSEAEGVAVFDLLRQTNFPQTFRGRSSAKLKRFAEWCRKLGAVEHKPVNACVRSVLDLSGLVEHIGSRADRDPAAEDRIENLDAFLNRAAEFEGDHPDADLGAFLEDVALVADVDTWDPDADQLTLMTLHAAKGLEFPVVFVVGLEDGLLPHKNSWKPAMLEEERRLFYVGLTRAEERVFLCHAEFRYLSGQTNVSPPSRFLAELPLEFVDAMELADGVGPSGTGLGTGARDWDDLDDGLDLGDGDGFDPADDVQAHPDYENPSDAAAGQPVEVGAGDHVTHPTFGAGRVLSVRRRKAVVQFFTGGTRLLHLDEAGLQRS